MIFTVPLLSKASFLGSLINKCRPAAVANFSISRQLNASKTLEEKVGMPIKPKKPLTPFFRYMNEQRSKLLAENPKVRLIEIVSLIAKQWGKEDAAIKQRLLEEYKKDKEKYIEARTKYDSKVTDEQRLKLKELKQERVQAKERRMMKNRIKDLGRPKKPASAFLRFISKERISNPQSPNESFREWHQKATARWATISDNEKEIYFNQSRKDHEKYKADVALWEEQMIRLGNIDVVRHRKLLEHPEHKPKKS